jgi:exopolysaccharide production protein ExoQ
VSQISRPVFADHLNIPDVYARGYQWLTYGVVVVILSIQSTAAYNILNKFGVPGLGVVWFLGSFLCLLFAALNAKATLKGAIRGWPVVLLSLWAFASYLWTVDTYQTLRGLLLLVSAHVFAFALAGTYRWEQLIGFIAATLCTLAGLSVIMALALPQLGQMQSLHIGAWSGVWGEKQALAFYSSSGFIAALFMAGRGPNFRFWWIGAGVCAIAIVGSTSRTGLMMLFVSLAVWIWLRMFYRNVVGKVIGSWVIALGAIVSIPILSGSFDIVLKLLGRSSNLTGRTEIWKVVQQIGDMQPMHGWGYQSVFGNEDVMTSPFQWIAEATDFKPPHAHSSWLDMYLQLGQVGVGLLVLFTVWAWASLFFASKITNKERAYAGAALAGITFISFTETVLVTPLELNWFLVVLIACKLNAPDNALAADKLSPVDDNGGNLDGATYTYDA